MPDKLHGAVTTTDGIHTVVAAVVADAAARLALSWTTADLGKVAYQADTRALWVVRDNGGLEWYELGTPASLTAQVATNATDIGLLTTDLGNTNVVVGGHTTQLGTQAGLIAGNTSAIGANTTAIAGKADKLTPQNAQSGTTLTLTDAMNGQAIKLTNAAGCTVTVPGTLTVGDTFAVLVMNGAGQATFVGSAGLTVYGPPGLTLKSRTGGTGIARLTVEILSATEACLSGDVQ